MTSRATRITTFLAAAGWGTASRAPLAGDASARRYERLTLGSGTAVLMDAPPQSGPVRPFIAIANHLRSLGLSAPEIYAADEPSGLLLLEDLGDALFSRAIATDPSLQNRLYSGAIDVLATLARHPAPSGLTRLSPHLLADMIAPAFDWYLPGATDQATDHSPITAQFRQHAETLLTGPDILMLRDFHAENLIWLPDRAGAAQVGLLDFQDAMAAHPAYDLVSILQDARRDVPHALETAMIRRYIAATGQNAADFGAAYALLGAQRNLRILGVFARLSMHFGKAQYVPLIPRVWGYLQRNLSHPALPALKSLLAVLPAPTPETLQRITDKCGTIPTP